jgi:hypothetical protein
MIQAGIKPVYVFDGKPPKLKREELDRRYARAVHVKTVLEIGAYHYKYSMPDDLGSKECPLSLVLVFTSVHNGDGNPPISDLSVFWKPLASPSAKTCFCCEGLVGGMKHKRGSSKLRKQGTQKQSSATASGR